MIPMLISLIIWITVLGLVYYIFMRLVPIEPPFRTVIQVLIALLSCVWLLETFGLTRWSPWHR